MKMMKRLMTICLAIALLAGLAGAAEGVQEPPQIILYTCYTNLFPDGLELQAGCVDEDGGLWTLDLRDADLTGYATVGEYLADKRSTGEMVSAGQVEGIDMFELKSLIYDTEQQDVTLEAVCEGGGAESSYAIYRDVNGNETEILLGVSGDSKYENTDPDAQALYLLLRKFFPGVDHFAYSDMGPRGFQPVPVAEFCGWQDIDFSKVVIECGLEDCEEGPIPLELTDGDREEIIEIATTWQVVGKANAMILSGGPKTAGFYDGSGKYLGSLSLFEGLLVLGDGMYYISGQ